MMKQNAIIQTLSKPLLFATFFMAFPVFTIVQNISFFFLAYFFYKINAVTPQLLKVKTMMGVTAVFMIIAAFISTINAGLYFEIDNFINAVKVLPNYTYWGVLIIFLGNVFFRFSSFFMTSGGVRSISSANTFCLLKSKFAYYSQRSPSITSLTGTYILR
jgi:hypothetical protein